MIILRITFRSIEKNEIVGVCLYNKLIIKMVYARRAIPIQKTYQFLDSKEVKRLLA